MNKGESEDIIKKYLSAESTLKEEEILFQDGDQNANLGDWFRYVNQNRPKAPSDLKDSIWKTIQTRKRKNLRRRIILLGAAAAILLLIGVFTFDAVDERREYAKKEALLEEAKSMFAEEKQATEQENILFENDIVIIYLAKNLN